MKLKRDAKFGEESTRCFKIGIRDTTRHGVTRKETQKRLQVTENLIRENLLSKDVCYFWTESHQDHRPKESIL